MIRIQAGSKRKPRTEAQKKKIAVYRKRYYKEHAELEKARHLAYYNAHREEQDAKATVRRLAKRRLAKRVGAQPAS